MLIQESSAFCLIRYCNHQQKQLMEDVYSVISVSPRRSKLQIYRLSHQYQCWRLDVHASRMWRLEFIGTESVMYNCVSSAYLWYLMPWLSNRRPMDDTYAVKRIGPRTDPWGMPAEVWTSPDDDVLTQTWRFFRSNMIRYTAEGALLCQNRYPASEVECCGSPYRRLRKWWGPQPISNWSRSFLTKEKNLLYKIFMQTKSLAAKLKYINFKN